MLDTGRNDPQARRLLGIYSCRLHSNLVAALGYLAPRAEARRIAEGIAALIDGHCGSPGLPGY